MSTTPPRFARTAFRKSSHSEPHLSCVEIARAADEVAIRDSKTVYGSPADAHLAFAPAQFDAFLSSIRKGGLIA